MTNEAISRGVVSTHAFYGDPGKAADYVAKTKDLVVNLDPFLSKLPSGVPPSSLRILDAGCGSGRDTKAFMDRGYRVEAFDASAALVEKARELTKALVIQCLFQDFFVTSPRYDGIWAQASLLHVPRAALPDVIFHLADSLVFGGLLWATFKYGAEPTIDNRGRFFTNMTEDSAKALFRGCPLLERVECEVESGSSSGGEPTSWVTVYGFKNH